MQSLLDFSDKNQKDAYQKIKSAKFGKQGKSGTKNKTSSPVSKIETVESQPSGSGTDSDKKVYYLFYWIIVYKYQFNIFTILEDKKV